MRRAARWAGLGLATVSALAGCKGFWNAPTGGGGNGAASGVFYVLNQQTSQLAGFKFASGSTTPAAISGSPYALGFAPLCMAIAPSGSFLYVGTGGGVLGYSIGTGGALTALSSGSAISSEQPSTMTVDSTGTWLLVGTSGAATLNAIPISASTGLLDSARTEQNTSLPSGALIQQVAATSSSAANDYIFLAMGPTGTAIIPFSASSSTPFPATWPYRKVKNTSGSANAVGVDPGGHLLYVGETAALTGTQTGGLRVFTLGANAAVTEVSGSPFSTGGTGPSAILATANFVWVANRAVSGISTGNVTGYPVASSGGTYSLGTLINTLPTGDGTVGLAEESTGTYILAVNAQANPDLNTFTFDSTGKLTAGVVKATGTDPVQAIAVAAVP